MVYRLMGSDFDDFILSDEGRGESEGEAQVNRIAFATPKGDILFREHNLSPTLSILEGHYAMADEVTIAGKGEESLLEIQFNLSERAIHFRDKSMGERVTPAGSGNIAFLPADENEATILFQKDVDYHTFDVHLPVVLLNRFAGESKLLDQFLGQIHRNASAMLFPRNIRITPVIYNVIRDIKTCAYEGLTRKIYLESKAYEMIALLYDENAGNGRIDHLLRSADQERVQQAAAIIRDNLERPLTILELARRVGVNQTKLKTGFKLLFGKTVFEYLQDIRMHRAKRYLLDTQLSIQEIGLLTGYQNTSNFSIAFKRIHGYPPTKLRENKGDSLPFVR